MILKNYFFLFLFCYVVTLASSCTRTKNTSGGILPSEALATFELASGFQIEMVASEPLVADPVAMEIDEYGRMYVVEMHGYPLDKSGSGKIKLLSDNDGDGQMDESVVFADKLLLPTGILRWKKGILVTDPPNVLYLEDTDGDGEADVRDTVLTGFAVSNPQHNFNNPILGIDNWIYVGHEPAVTTQLYQKEFGDRGGDVYYTDFPNDIRLPDNARGRSVRFRPERSGLEILSSNTQFGHTFDLYGNHLLVSNANHIYHEVIAAPYLVRNPDLLVSNATQSISDHGNAADVFPITTNPDHQLLTDVGVFTSACGLTYYAGGLFPSPFDSVTFVAEPVSNIVHADVIREKGASFTASRMYSDKEFLASTDAWFRPVNTYVGPDGALYVVDYYRQIIEHPEWMAEDVVKSGALYNGTEQGRIYRITPKGTPPMALGKSITLGDASNEELVEKLADPNVWWRRNAQRLLLDRQALDVKSALVEMAENQDSPLGRLHALWTLEGLDQLQAEHLVRALKDPEAGIRENAIRLSEPFLLSSSSIVQALQGMEKDPNAKVRFQLLSTLGSVDTPEAATVRKNILFHDFEDPWVQIAALSAHASNTSDLLNAVIDRFDADKPAFGSLVERLSAMVGASGQVPSIHELLQQSIQVLPGKKGAWQANILKGLAAGMRGKDIPRDALVSEQKQLLKAAFEHPSPAVRKGSISMLGVVGIPEGTEGAAAAAGAAKTVADTLMAIDKRIEAIQFLALANPQQHAPLLTSVLVPSEPYSIQFEALMALSAIPDETVSRVVLEKWAGFTPDLRNAAINTFMGKDDRVVLLLDALEQGIIDQASIGWGRSVGLMAQKNDKLKSRARALLTKRDEERGMVIQQYQSALTMKGDPVKGEIVFQENCSSCHQVGGAGGIAFGPDLGTIRGRSAVSVMNDILDPNLSIADGYDIWTIDLISGESIQGLIGSESPVALTIRSQAGEERTIPRQSIASLKPMGMSTMPVGLEKQVSPERMADLLAFIRNK